MGLVDGFIVRRGLTGCVVCLYDTARDIQPARWNIAHRRRWLESVGEQERKRSRALDRFPFEEGR